MNNFLIFVLSIGIFGSCINGSESSATQRKSPSDAYEVWKIQSRSGSRLSTSSEDCLLDDWVYVPLPEENGKKNEDLLKHSQLSSYGLSVVLHEEATVINEEVNKRLIDLVLQPDLQQEIESEEEENKLENDSLQDESVNLEKAVVTEHGSFFIRSAFDLYRKSGPVRDFLTDVSNELTAIGSVLVGELLKIPEQLDQINIEG